LSEIVELELAEKIKLLSPGTKLRKALDDIIHAQLGALIVFIDEEEFPRYSSILQSGFKLDCPFSPERL